MLPHECRNELTHLVQLWGLTPAALDNRAQGLLGASQRGLRPVLPHDVEGLFLASFSCQEGRQAHRHTCVVSAGLPPQFLGRRKESRGRSRLASGLEPLGQVLHRCQNQLFAIMRTRRRAPCAHGRREGMQPRVCPQLFALCSLLAAPCSLLFAPCSLLPAPCPLLPAPCSLQYLQGRIGIPLAYEDLGPPDNGRDFSGHEAFQTREPGIYLGKVSASQQATDLRRQKSTFLGVAFR